MEVLILGKGFIGSMIYNHLQHNKIKSAIVSKQELDYTDYWTLSNYLYSNNITTVINASGYTGIPNIDAAEDDKENCWKMNVEVPFAILRAIENESNYRIKLIHISSGCIYNGYEKQWTEKDTPNFGLFNTNSSFYSKTKHAAETILKESNQVALLRIRMPFSGGKTSRNYFSKILGYDNLISVDNSVTCIEDLCELILSFCRKETFPFGIWNVVNEGSLSAKQVVDCLSKYGLTNPNHRFIALSELKTKAPRSNCILSTEKTKQIFLMPNALDSLEKCVKSYVRIE